MDTYILPHTQHATFQMIASQLQERAVGMRTKYEGLDLANLISTGAKGSLLTCVSAAGLSYDTTERHFVPIIHLRSEKQILPKRMLHLSEQMGEPGWRRGTFISSDNSSS